MSNSPVQFSSRSRLHVGLAVSSVEQSVDFYRQMFGVEPSKRREGYARFEVEDPSVNLSLIESEAAQGPSDPISHYGIQVKSIEAVRQFGQRLKEKQLPIRIESVVSCCHAVQEKVWTQDPDQQRWEVYTVLDDSPESVQPTKSNCNVAPGEAHPHSSECCKRDGRSSESIETCRETSIRE